MTYLDKYKDCCGCPHRKYCGTMVSSIRLCHSYKEDDGKDKRDNTSDVCRLY